MSGPHPQLVPLLEKYGISWQDFTKRGRPPKGLREKREVVMTELHSAGTTWAEMREITGLSLMGIQRLTKATWNDASRKNRQESAARLGHARKGERKPWLTEQMWSAWRGGKFDFHLGRAHSDEERARQRASYTPEVRARMSQAKVAYFQAHPGRVFRSRPREVLGLKAEAECRFTVRSSYEAAAVRLLEADVNVSSYAYEPRLNLPSGKAILPDFVVQRLERTILVEVKPMWVLRHYRPGDRPIVRLNEACEEAHRRGWDFVIWTEEVLFAPCAA